MIITMTIMTMMVDDDDEVDGADDTCGDHGPSDDCCSSMIITIRILTMTLMTVTWC